MFDPRWLEEYISSDCRLKGGCFLFYDEINSRPLALQFRSLSPRRIRDLGQGERVACVEMASQDGKYYDVDFRVRGEAPEELEVLGIMIHAVDGETRYEWVKTPPATTP